MKRLRVQSFKAILAMAMLIAGCSMPGKPSSDGSGATAKAAPTPTAPTFSYTGTSFAATSIGYPISSTVTVTLTNNTVITLLSSALSPNSRFTNLGTGTCTNGKVLRVNQSCTINLRFTPTDVGTTQSTMVFQITGSESVSAFSVNLTGSADDHLPDVALSSYSVPDVIFGSSSAPIPITMTNNGNKALAPVTMTFGTARYAVSGSTCGASLAPGASCNFNVVFTPHMVANNIANVLTITDGVTAKTFNFSGNGILGSVTHFAFTSFPGTVTSGSPQTITVTAKDANENTVTTYNNQVTLSSSDPSASLGAPANLVNGAATFAATLFTVGTQSITATDGSITSAKTGIIVTAAAAHHLVFTTEPSALNTAGVNFGTQPVVKIYDQYNNLKTDINAGTITLSISSGSLSGGSTASISGGVATFSGTKTNQAGTAKLLVASYLTLTVNSANFDVVPAAIASLAFTSQPSANATAGSALAQQPAVTAYDAFSNIVTNDSSTNITLTAHTDAACASAAVGGGITATANPKQLSAGVATFANTVLTDTDIVRIKASDGTHTVCSNAITVGAGAAASIAFTTQPSASTVAGVAFATQPVVTVYDSNNNALTTLNAGNITLSISSGSLAAGTTAAISSGVASFSGTKTNQAGAGKTLTATYGGLTAQSDLFTILPAAYDATQSAFTVSANTVASGSTITTTLTTKDAFGNTNPSGLPAIGSIAFSSSLVGGTGTFAALNNAGSGVYTSVFTGGAAGLVTLSASISGNSVTETQDVTVGAGAATQLVLASIPATKEAGVSFNFSVTAKDAFGNIVTSYPETVTITSSDGAATLPAASALTNGTKSFAITLNTVGTQTISAGDGTLTVTSTDINVTSSDQAPPPDPTNLTGIVNSTSQISLSWASGGGTTADYRISYQSGATAPADCASGTTISEASIAGTSKSISGLTANTQYSFRVCAINGDGTPDVSSGITITKTTQANHTFPIGINNYYFDQPKSLTIDAYGNWYIANANSGVIQKFDSTGALLLSFGTHGNGAGEFGTWGLYAGADSDGYIYVLDPDHSKVHKYDSSGTYILSMGSAGSGDGQFDFPMGIAVDPTGNVFVADMNNHRIQKFNSSGVFQSKFGSFGATDGQFTQPTSIALDSNGNIYVGDGTGRVQKFNSSGTHQFTFGSLGSGNGQFSIIGGIAIDSDGKIHVADSDYFKIQKFDVDGSYISTYASNMIGMTSGLAIDSNGKIWAADFDNNRIERFNPNGTFDRYFDYRGSANGEFHWQRGVALDSQGNIFVADTNNNRIQKFDSSGTYLMSITHAGLNIPYDVAIDSSDNIYAVSPDANAVFKFDSSGNYVTSWGTTGSGNGEFNYVTAIAAGSDGIYVADTGNDRIQKFSFAGVFIYSSGSTGSTNGKFSNAADLFVDANDYVYVADYNNDRIEKYNGANGSYLSTISSARVSTVTVDSNGNIWSMDSTGDPTATVRKYNAAGVFQSSFTVTAGDSMVIDANDNIYISHLMLSVIKKYDTSGNEQSN